MVNKYSRSANAIWTYGCNDMQSKCECRSYRKQAKTTPARTVAWKCIAKKQQDTHWKNNTRWSERAIYISPAHFTTSATPSNCWASSRAVSDACCRPSIGKQKQSQPRLGEAWARQKVKCAMRKVYVPQTMSSPRQKLSAKSKSTFACSIRDASRTSCSQHTHASKIVHATLEETVWSSMDLQVVIVICFVWLVCCTARRLRQKTKKQTKHVARKLRTKPSATH